MGRRELDKWFDLEQEEEVMGIATRQEDNLIHMYTCQWPYSKKLSACGREIREAEQWEKESARVSCPKCWAINGLDASYEPSSGVAPGQT